jgi:hypothetical protein
VTFDGNWHPVTVPISNLAAGRPWADISRTKIFFSLYVDGATGGAQTFSVDNVRWDTRRPGTLDRVTLSPTTAFVPPGFKRLFTISGLDSANVPVDVDATWTMQGNLGTLNATTGNHVLLTAGNTLTSGQLTATATNGLFATANVTIGPVQFNQSFNVYSDNGSADFIGADFGPKGNTTNLTLTEPTSGGNPPEGTKYMHAAYTLQNSQPDANDSYAVWFVSVSAVPKNIQEELVKKYQEKRAAENK